MDKHTTFFEQNIVHKDFFSGIDEIESIYSKIDLILHENLYSLEKDSYHFIGQLLKNIALKDRASRAFASNIFKACYQSELISAGGANIGFLFGVTLAKELLKTPLETQNQQIVMDEFNKLMENFKEQLESNSKKPTEKDIQKLVFQICKGNQELATAVWESLKLAGLEGKIVVEVGRQKNYLVELKTGYDFNFKPFKFMLDNSKHWERNRCKALIVDGLVEKVSEIDHLLRESMNNKIPMVIIAHGFSEEVAATLKTNKDRGLLDVQPVRIPSDVDSLNVVNDVATVCGTLPISSMKGDLVSYTNYEDLPLVDKIRLSPEKCVIENNKTKGAVSAQVKNILQKRQSHFLHEEVQELFDKRLKSLNSSTVVLYLPNCSTVRADDEKVKIDLCLRQCKTMLNYGTVNLPQELSLLKEKTIFKSDLEQETQNLFIRTIKSFSKKCNEQGSDPTLSCYLGMLLTGKSVLLLLTSAGFVAFE